VIEVRRALGGAEFEQALELRRAVFVDEQGVPESAERDDRDSEAVHLVALKDETVVGTCRLLLTSPSAPADMAVGSVRLGRLAVAPEQRRRGIASALLASAEREARAAGASRIVLHAQTYAWRLYAALGYERCGEPFQEAGLEHITMERRLA
jgi:predicted GNAT family N-acyltransferase